MLQERIPLQEPITSGRRFTHLPTSSGQFSINVNIDSDIEAYISSNAFGDIVITHRISRRSPLSEAYHSMLASETVLAKDWGQPDEDEAWAHL